MEQYRKQYANEIRINIHRIENGKKRDEENLINMRNLNLSSELFCKKQEELNNIIQRRKEELKILEEREQDFLNGKLDQEIKEEMEKNTLASNNRQISSLAKKRKKGDIIEEEKKFRTMDRAIKYEEKNIRKDQQFYYRLFSKANETLPNYIKTNLSEMPGNKGYIWRDCWFFGCKPDEYGQPVVMFEKRKGAVMYIHEIYPHEHKIFEKVGKERKKLISTKIRKVKIARPIKW